MQVGPIRFPAFSLPVSTAPVQPVYQFQPTQPSDQVEIGAAPALRAPQRTPLTRHKLALLGTAALGLALSVGTYHVPGRSAAWASVTQALPNSVPKVPQTFSKDAVQGYYLDADEEELSEAGRALYESIRSRHLGQSEKLDFGSPTAYFTGGLPGSGKGQILEKMQSMGGFVVVDPDCIKRDVIADLVEKNPALKSAAEKDPDWGTVVHWTSSLLAKELMRDALKAGADVVYDSSMSTPDRQRYKDFVDLARSQGYRIHAMICQVGVQKSIERAESRAGKPVTVELPEDEIRLPGRRVTAEYVRECAGRLDENLLLFQAAGFFDHVSIYDNNLDGQPMRLISSAKKR